MNFFKNIFQTHDLDNVELAYQLLNYDIEKPIQYKKAVKNILNQFSKDEQGNWDRKEWLLKIIELTGAPSTSKQQYLLSTCYYYLGASYRKEAIEYLELYINNGIWEGLFTYAPTNGLYDYKKLTLVNTMHWLAECYEKEYQFDKALNIYEKMINILPNYPISYTGKVSVLTKKNCLENCLTWLKAIKKSSMYKTYTYCDEFGNEYKNTDFKNIIDKMIEETQKKIKKGYIYRPRNKNR